MSSPAADADYLAGDADPDALLSACLDNHVEWLRRIVVASGGEFHRTGGLEWVTTTVGGRRTATVALGAAPGPRTAGDLATVVQQCRAEGVVGLGVWAGRRADARSLGGLLAARGGVWGARPRWMVLDSRDLTPPPMDGALEAAEMTLPDRLDDHVEPDLLCYHPDLSAVRQAMMRARPQRVWHGIQWDAGRPVGQTSFNLTVGPFGVLGLHEGAVVPHARSRGPRLARFDLFTRFAKDAGARYVVLNATSRSAPLYRAAGFSELGEGQTWWFSEHALAAVPSAATVGLAEAVGAGMPIPAVHDVDTLDAPLPNGMTPLQLAGRAGRPESAQRLLEHGCAPDLLAYWDLGWRGAIDRMLAADPAAARAVGPAGRTILHEAVARDDPELASLLITAGADLDARDTEFGATPLEWAVKTRKSALGRVLHAAARRAAEQHPAP